MEAELAIGEIIQRNLDTKGKEGSIDVVNIFNEHISQCVSALEAITGTNAAAAHYSIERLKEGGSVDLYGCGSFEIKDKGVVVKNMALIIKDSNGHTAWSLKVFNKKDNDGYQVVEATTSAGNDKPRETAIQALTDLVIYQYKDHVLPITNK